MRVRNEYSCKENEDNFALTKFSVIQETVRPISKFNASFERKIERLWFQSRHAGWSYNEFAVHLLEVLAVLRHREGVKRAAAAKRRVAAQ